MTRSLFPVPVNGSRVELDNQGQNLPDVRVVRVADTSVTVSLALAHINFAAGSTVTLRWPAGPRGRCVQPGIVLEVDENRVEIEFSGEPEIEQLRNYVRGGGGEIISLVLPGKPETMGQVRDISERSVRAQFADADLEPGQEMRLRVQLGDDEIVELPATALRVSSTRQQVPAPGPLLTEIVAIFEQDEHQATIIRRYLMRLQLQARREAAEAEKSAGEIMSLR